MFLISTIKLNIELNKKNRKINSLILQKESLEELIKSDLYSNFMKMVGNDDKVKTFAEENYKLRAERKEHKLKILQLETENKELMKRGGKNGKRKNTNRTVHKKSK